MTEESAFANKKEYEHAWYRSNAQHNVLLLLTLASLRLSWNPHVVRVILQSGSCSAPPNLVDQNISRASPHTDEAFIFFQLNSNYSSDRVKLTL